MIPDFQSIMLPLLKFSGDQEEHSIADAISYLGKEFNLTEDELNEWLPSKSQKIFYNRVYWAKAYLKMAGLLDNTKRSHFKITAKGVDVLNENPPFINIKYLRKFQEFVSAIELKNSESKDQSKNSSNFSSPDTPEELLQEAHKKINETLKIEVISRIKKYILQILKNWL